MRRQNYAAHDNSYSEARKVVRAEIASRLEAYLTQQAMSAADLATAHYKELDYGKVTGALFFLTGIRKGYSLGCTTSTSKGFGFTSTESSRLARLFSLLGISADDALVGKLKRESSSFQYPLVLQ